jgi:hypothetical protein
MWQHTLLLNNHCDIFKLYTCSVTIILFLLHVVYTM